jgi:hypothetical protein
MRSKVLTSPSKIASSTNKVAFQDVQKADNEFSRPFTQLKHHFGDFVQVAFLNAQDAQNEFACPFETLKYRFIDITKVVF